MLTYPNFAADASPFVLQTDASAVGIGAVLEQEGHVIAYFSRALTKAEKHYSVIQQECLAAVAAMKQFRHYLLGRQFTLMTDHAPLQWLSAQKMEGIGTNHTNHHCVAITKCGTSSPLLMVLFVVPTNQTLTCMQ